MRKNLSPIFLPCLLFIALLTLAGCDGSGVLVLRNQSPDTLTVIKRKHDLFPYLATWTLADSTYQIPLIAPLDTLYFRQVTDPYFPTIVDLSVKGNLTGVALLQATDSLPHLKVIPNHHYQQLVTADTIEVLPKEKTTLAHCFLCSPLPESEQFQDADFDEIVIEKWAGLDVRVMREEAIRRQFKPKRSLGWPIFQFDYYE